MIQSCPKSADGLHKFEVFFDEECKCSDIECKLCGEDCFSIADVEEQARQSERNQILGEPHGWVHWNCPECGNAVAGTDGEHYFKSGYAKALDDVEKIRTKLREARYSGECCDYHVKQILDDMKDELNSLRNSGGEGK